MHPSYRELLVAAVVLVALAIPVLAQSEAQPKRQALPDAPLQATMEQRVKELYKREFAAAKLPEQRRTLATQLLKVGVETKDDSHGRYALFVVAKDLAASDGNLDLATEAVKLISQHYEVNERELFQATLVATAKGTRTPQLQQQAATMLLQTAEEEMKHDRFESVKLLLDTAKQLPKKEAFMTAKLVLRSREAELFAQEFKNAEPAIKLLAEKPTDPEANQKVGWYRCVVKDDWVTGLPYLALGNDETLSELARQEISASPDAKSLGDSWWELAEGEEGLGRERFLARASKWYSAALPQTSGLTKATLESRLTTIATNDKPVAGELTKSQAATLAKLSLSGTWKSLATGNEFTLQDRGTKLVVSQTKSKLVTSFAGTLVREENRLHSIQWDSVFTGDPSKQVRKGTFSGEITNPNRIKAKFTKWDFDDKGNVIRTYTGHTVWIRKVP